MSFPKFISKTIVIASLLLPSVGIAGTVVNIPADAAKVNCFNGVCPDSSSAIVTTTGATTAAPLSRLAPLSLLGFGATCDGTTNDTAAITAAIASGKVVNLPDGVTCNAASTNWLSMPGAWIGNGTGRLKASDGNLRGPTFLEQTAAPASLGTYGNVVTYWNGDWSKTVGIEKVVSGAATAGQPASGYVMTPELSALNVTGFNTSGWNQSLSGNNGRTGNAVINVRPTQSGQGDYVGIWCSGIVTGSLPGATSYLASPAVECLGGQLFGSAPGQYIEYLGDMVITDNGFDIAAVGAVWNLDRRAASEGLGTNWMGTRINSSGTVPIDLFDQRAGPAAVGMDYAGVNLAFYRLAGVAVNSGGSGYTQGDMITVSGGTAVTPTVFTANVTAGAITSLTVVNTGIYTTAPNALTAFGNITVTGGTGTGLAIAGQYGGNVWALLPPAGGCIQPSGTGSVTQRMSGINGVLCLAANGMTFGHLGTNTNSGPAGSDNVQLGTGNNALGSGSIQLGKGCYDQAQKNTLCFASGNITGVGQIMNTKRVFWKAGTTQTRITSDGGVPSTQNSYFMQRGLDNIRFVVSAVDSTNGDTATWSMKSGTLSLVTAGGTLVYMGDASTATAPDRSTGAGSTASLIVAADNATVVDTLSIQVTPPNAHVWYFSATVEGEHLGF